MKQLIIMMAMIMLGIGIAGIVLDFQDTAENLGKKGMERVMTVVEAPAAASK